MKRISLHKVITYFKDIGQFWHWVGKQFIRDGCVTHASALTYTSLLALVPLMVVIFSALSMFPFFSTVSGQLQDFVFTNFMPHTGDTIREYLIHFEQQAHLLPMVSFAFLLITAILMLLTLEKTLNTVWMVDKKRRWRSSLLMYWAILTIGPMIIGTSVLLSSYLLTLKWIAGGVEYVGIAYFLSTLSFAFIVIGFAFMYIIVPNCSVKLWDALRGAFVSAVLFEVAKQLFSYYVVNFPTYTLLYGALATIPLFLLWLYLLWMIFLFGAEVVNGLRLRQAKRIEHDRPLFIVAYRLLAYIWQCQQTNKPCTLMRLLCHEPTYAVSAIRCILDKMEDKNIIHSDDAESYFVKTDLHQFSLYQFIRAMRLYVPEPTEQLGDISNEPRLKEVLQQYSNQAKALHKPLIGLM